MTLEYGIGQTWKNRRRKPSATFTILRIYERVYAPPKPVRLRVKGVLVTGEDGLHTHLRDLDAASARAMFPFILFAPAPAPEDNEDK